MVSKKAYTRSDFKGVFLRRPLTLIFRSWLLEDLNVFPAFFVAPGFPGIARPAYFGAWTIGAGFRAVPNEDVMGSFLAKLTLKAELVYKAHYAFDSSPVESPDDYFAFVLGVDRVFNDLILDQDQLTLTLEYAREFGANDRQSVFRPFRNDLIIRLFWEANDFSRTSLEARALIDLSDDEVIWELIFKRQLRFISEDLTFTMQIQGFEAADPGESLYSTFPDNTSVLVGLRWNF